MSKMGRGEYTKAGLALALVVERLRVWIYTNHH